MKDTAIIGAWFASFATVLCFLLGGEGGEPLVFLAGVITFIATTCPAVKTLRRWDQWNR